MSLHATITASFLSMAGFFVAACPDAGAKVEGGIGKDCNVETKIVGGSLSIAGGVVSASGATASATSQNECVTIKKAKIVVFDDKNGNAAYDEGVDTAHKKGALSGNTNSKSLSVGTVSFNAASSPFPWVEMCGEIEIQIKNEEGEVIETKCEPFSWCINLASITNSGSEDYSAPGATPANLFARGFGGMVDITVDWQSTGIPGVLAGYVRADNFQLPTGDPKNWGQTPLVPTIGGVISNGQVFMMAPSADGTPGLEGTFYAFEQHRDVYIEVRDAAGRVYATSVDVQFQ